MANEYECTCGKTVKGRGLYGHLQMAHSELELKGLTGNDMHAALEKLANQVKAKG